MTTHSGRIGLALVSMVLIAATVWMVFGPYGGPPARGRPVSQAYPPPTNPPATETPTPTPDSAGYMPVPNVTTTLVTLSSSPYAAILTPMQAALSEPNVDWFVQMVMVGDRGVPIGFSPVGCVEGCGATLAVPDEFAARAAEAVDSGTALVQGYFDDPYVDADDSSLDLVCIWVIAGAFDTTVAYPTSPPGMYGESNPSTIELDSSAIKACRANGLWSIDEWRFGGYYELVEAFVEEFGLSPYYIIRP